MGKSYGWAIVNEKNEILFISHWHGYSPSTRQLAIFMTKWEAKEASQYLEDFSKIIKVYFGDSPAYVTANPIITV